MPERKKIETQLREIAMNLWWSWHPGAIRLFRDIDAQVFHASHHSALAVCQSLTPERLRELAGDAVIRARLDRVHRELRAYLDDGETWADTHAAPLRVRPVAYFSAEFGLHESLPIYSGGLGILAGDHLKTASDLGLALVGVGLFYRESYFRQLIDEHGQQHAQYDRAPLPNLPVQQMRDRDGRPLLIDVELGPEKIFASVWLVHVGRTRLLLLDTDVEQNTPENRELGARLYFGDSRVRIRQELLLGVGGVRALRAAGIAWSILHLNEGHSAFATLEWARLLMQDSGLDFDTAAQEVAQSTVFTTHTPVAAGHDRFAPDLADAHLGPLQRSLGLDKHRFMSLGRVNPHDEGEQFCMTVLAFKLSRRANGVSALHGRVSRRAWRELWPHMREDDLPIGHVTNGVHVSTWVAPGMQEFFAQHLGADWRQHITDPELWARIDGVNDAELWEMHRVLKASLVNFVRREAAAHRSRAGLAESQVAAAASALDPDALTIGFARRFATYKRGNLLFTDLECIRRLVEDSKRPVQFIFSGKAHPADQPGQAVIRQVYQATLDPAFQGRIAFLEDYDINVARHLVQGVDVWLNTPRRPNEASGTSGMKAVLNGALNLSILDGWWAEAYNGKNGFAIGNGRQHVNEEITDQRDAQNLIKALRDEVIPLYYNRDADGLPRQWIAMMVESIATLAWRFSAHRMVMDYVRKCYLVAAGGLSSDMNRL